MGQVMICFMFPGQPMAMTETAGADADSQKIAAACLQRTGIDPFSASADGADVTDAVRLQLHGVAVSLWRERQLLKQGLLPAVIAEHSLGIYPALAAAGVISGEEALEMAFRVGICMAKMGTEDAFMLACVTGLAEEPLAAVAANNGTYLANYNTSRHFLLAGPRHGIQGAVVEAEAAGAFSVSSFPCDAPLHTPLMEELAADLRTVFADYRYRDPQIPVMEHIGQGFLTAAGIPAFLCEELCRPVYWERSCRALHRHGVSRFAEVGAGQALTKFNRWIENEP